MFCNNFALFSSEIFAAFSKAKLYCSCETAASSAAFDVPKIIPPNARSPAPAKATQPAGFHPLATPNARAPAVTPPPTPAVTLPAV